MIVHFLSYMRTCKFFWQKRNVATITFRTTTNVLIPCNLSDVFLLDYVRPEICWKNP